MIGIEKKEYIGKDFFEIYWDGFREEQEEARGVATIICRIHRTRNRRDEGIVARMDTPDAARECCRQNGTMLGSGGRVDGEK